MYEFCRALAGPPAPLSPREGQGGPGPRHDARHARQQGAGAAAADRPGRPRSPCPLHRGAPASGHAPSTMSPCRLLPGARWGCPPMGHKPPALGLCQPWHSTPPVSLWPRGPGSPSDKKPEGEIEELKAELAAAKQKCAPTPWGGWKLDREWQPGPSRGLGLLAVRLTIEAEGSHFAFFVSVHPKKKSLSFGL